MLKVAMLSKWHVHAEGYARELINSGKVKITAVWDECTATGEEWAKKLNADFEADLDKLLSRDDVEAVICDAPTTKHKDILIKAAKAKKHIFTEKALADTVEACNEIANAIKENGVTFAISYPHKFMPVVLFAKKCINNNDFGKITLIRVRNAHNGVSANWLPEYWFKKEDAAGGAMFDLGCHPMYLLSYFLGEPKRISGMFNSLYGKPVDENAVATIEFKNGTIGVAETSFISYASPYTIEIYGTEGIMLARDNDVLFRNKKTDEYQNGFIKPNIPGSNAASPIIQFVEACINKTGSPDGLGIDDAIALTELLENSYISNYNNIIKEL